MPEYIGYTQEEEVVARPDAFKLSDTHKYYFAAKEKELGREIRVRLVVGTVSAPLLEDKDFNGIVFYDAATNCREQEVAPSEVETISLDCGKVEMKKSRFWWSPKLYEGKSFVFTKGSLGKRTGQRALGAVEQNRIYSAIALSNYDKSDMLHEAFDAAIAGAADYALWAQEKSQAKRKVSNEFADKIEDLMQQDVNLLESRVRECVNDINRYNDQIADLYRLMRSKQQEKEIKLQYLGQDKVVAREKIESLFRNSMVDDIEVTEEYLSIYTKPMYLYSPNREERVLLGSMHVMIQYSDRVKIHNLNNCKRGRPHPHVDESGNPCWGASNQAINELMSDNDYPQLLEIIIAYLEQYNPHDAYGEYGAYWFETEDLEIKYEGQYKSKNEVDALLAAAAKEAEAKAQKEKIQAGDSVVVAMEGDRVTRILGRVGEEEEV